MKILHLITHTKSKWAALLLLSSFLTKSHAGSPLSTVYDQGGATTAVSINPDTFVAGGFQLGGSGYSYNLNNITLQFGNATGSGNVPYLNFSLYTNNGGTLGTQLALGTKIDDLYNPNSNEHYPSSAGAYTYSAQEVSALSLGTTYWLVASANSSEGGVPQWLATTGNPPTQSNPGTAYGTLTGTLGYDSQDNPVLTTTNTFNGVYLNFTVEANRIAYWTGLQGEDGFADWSSNNDGSTNFSRNKAGTTDFGATPDSQTDVLFSATNGVNKNTYLGTATTTIHNLISNDAGGVTIGDSELGATALNTAQILIGRGATDTGVLTLSGHNLSVNNNGDIKVGEYGTGTLNVDHGTKLTGVMTEYESGNYNPSAYIGYQTGSTGTMNVDGVGTAWTANDSIEVGRYAGSTGTLNISGGAYVNFDDEVTVGWEGKGTATVTGAGTILEIADNCYNTYGSIYVGYDNGNLAANVSTLNILDGGHVNTNYEDYIGYYGSGVVNVDGVNSAAQLNSDQPIYTRSTWNSGTLYIGYDANYSEGPSIQSSDSPVFSSQGTGTLNITNGALVNSTNYSYNDGSTYSYIGYNAGSVGVVNVDGTYQYISSLNCENEPSYDTYHSTWYAGRLYMGYYEGATATLNITNGGQVFVDNEIDISDGGKATVNVNGSGSLLKVTETKTGDVYDYSYGGLWVGYAGTGTLSISNGGLVQADHVYIGSDNGTYNTLDAGPAPADVPQGVVTVDGNSGEQQSALEAAVSLDVGLDYEGNGGTGTLNIINGGRVTVGLGVQPYTYYDYECSQTVTSSDYTTGYGTVNLGLNEGTSGILNIGTGGLAGYLEAAEVHGGDGTAVLNFNHTDYVEFGTKITGSISVNHIGSGLTELYNVNTYTGTTNITNGILWVGGTFNEYTYHVSDPVPGTEGDPGSGVYGEPGYIPPTPGTPGDENPTDEAPDVVTQRGSLLGGGDITVGPKGVLAGDGIISLACNASIYVQGAIVVDGYGSEPFSVSDFSNNLQFGGAPAILDLTTSGESAGIYMAPGSAIQFDLFSGAGAGDNLGVVESSDRINLHGLLDFTQGGALVINNPNDMTNFAIGDKWQLFQLNTSDVGRSENPGYIATKDTQSVTGNIPIIESSLHLDPGIIGSFDANTGVYEIIDYRPQSSALATGNQTASSQDQTVLTSIQSALGDINGRLFNLRAGGGQEGGNGGIAEEIDYGVVSGQGDGPEDKNPVAKKVLRSRQWEVYTTVNYSNINLSNMGTQAGLRAQTWAPSVGIERHLTPNWTVGFAVTLIETHQSYKGGLGTLDIQGPSLSTYLSYVKNSIWIDGLYSFGYLDLDSTRNPGFGFPQASGSTSAYTNAVQLNGGWNFRFQNNSLVTGPFVGLDYLHVNVDGYTESGGGLAALAYGKRDFDSLVSRIGWSVSKRFDTDIGTITPQFRLSYERQNISSNNATSAQLVNLPFAATTQSQSPGQDYMVVGTGVNFQFSQVFNMQLTYQTQIFRENMQAHFASVRFGYKF